MITSDEIREVSDSTGITIPDIQKDYVFGWILSGLYSISDLSEILTLKGGNAFRKGYYPNTRFSGDLDFSCETEIEAEFVKIELAKICQYVADNSGITFDNSRHSVGEKKRIDKDLRVIEARLYFNDFTGQENNIILRIRLDITQMDKIVFTPLSKKIIHPYSDSNSIESEIKVLRLEELYAHKLKCILQRKHCNDLYDIAFRLAHAPEIQLEFNKLLESFTNMTVFHRAPAAAKPILLDIPLQNLNSFWNRYLLCAPNYSIALESAIANFRQEIQLTFLNAPGGHQAFRFFSGKHRSILMEAGSNNKLVNVSYDGLNRECEPYCLSFRTRQRDRQSFEYLFVHDRTGGRSSGPGIKVFFGHKVDNIELTDKTFEPREQIDLKKSLISGNETTFERASTRKPKGRESKSRKVRMRGFGPIRPRKELKYQKDTIYVFECGACGKRFYRKKYDGKMNPHKTKDGYQCYGGYGTYIETRYPGYR